MKTLIFAFLFATQAAIATTEMIPSKPVIEARDCVLQIVAQRMGAQLKPEIKPPTVRSQTTTTLKEFQDSIEPFWKFRPDVFTNVYNPLSNEVFIMTERAYYEKHQRSVYDSLAHELAHYVQKEYQGADFTQADDTLELNAIDVQSWFRETYQLNFKGDQFVCPL